MAAANFPRFEACGHLIRTARAADGSGGWHVADVAVTHIEGEASRRAQLFATAPELLESLSSTASMLQAACLVIVDKEARAAALESVSQARAAIAKAAPRFTQTSCSQCGQDQGPGNSGYSSCADHTPRHVRITGEGCA